MACGPCAAKRLAAQTKHVWTSDDGASTVIYNSREAAQAKVDRRGGTFESVPASELNKG